MNLTKKIKLKKTFTIFAALIFAVAMFASVSFAETENMQTDTVDISWLKQFINEGLINKIISKLSEFGVVVKTEIRTVTVADDGELSKIINSSLQNINLENIDALMGNDREVKQKLERLEDILEKEIL